MLSIVIPTYKRFSSLQKCLESVIPQITEGMEMIVIDDFSQDETREYLLGLARKHDFLKPLLNPVNKGVNYSRNRGIELASKKFILFLDNDDEMMPGSLQEIVQVLMAYPATKHFLFQVSDRTEEFKHISEVRKILYEDWIGGRISGDFTHVILTEVIKKYPFFEEFRMYEHLNWLRIKKETSPQLMVPILTMQRDRDRSDSLTASGKLKNVSVIRSKFEAEKVYYALYHDDLKLHNHKALTTSMLYTVALGVACSQKQDCRKLIGYTDKGYIKLLGGLIMMLPSPLVKYGVLKYSALKG